MEHQSARRKRLLTYPAKKNLRFEQSTQKKKVRGIAEYELLIVGSSMQIDRWTGEAEDFLKKFQKELAKKKVALFVSSGAQALIEHEEKPDYFNSLRCVRYYI